MAIPHAAPGMPVNLQPLGETLSQAQTNALVKNETFEAIRLVIPKGHEVCRNHQVAGMITVQCLAGRIAFTVEDRAHELSAGDWVFLTGGVPHSISGLEDSLALLTVMFR